MVSVRYLSDFNSKFFTRDFLYTFLVGGNSNILGIFTLKIGEDEPILTKGVGSTTNLLCPTPCCRFEAIALIRVVEVVPWAIVFPHGISWFTRRRHHFPVVFFFHFFFSGELRVGRVDSLKMKMHPEMKMKSGKSSSDLPSFFSGICFFFFRSGFKANELIQMRL